MLTLYTPRVPSLRPRYFPTWDPWTSYADESREMMHWYPRVDITREDGHYKLTAEFPGMKEDDVNIEVQDGVLTLSGEKKSEFSEETDGCMRTERAYGSFSRSFTLPSHVAADKIEATLEKGILTVTIPVEEEEVRKIDVKAA